MKGTHVTTLNAGPSPVETGRRVLITGAASGMGRAAAKMFDEHGDRVALVDRDIDGARRVLAELAAPERHLAVEMDVADRASVRDGFETVKEAFDELDVAFLAAGVVSYSDDGPIADVGEETWNRMVDVNLKGAFLTARAAFAMMLKASTSSIVTVASVAAVIGQKRLYSYSAAKGGVLAFSRTLAIEAGKSGVRVNCICPGAVETPMTAEILKRSKPINVLGRPGTPEEIATVVLGITEPGAGFLTGAAISIDGGAAIV